MKNKLFLTLLFSLILFFGIDNVSALETTISPSASCFWTHSGGVSCPSTGVFTIDNDVYNGYTASTNNVSKVTFDYPLGWVGDTNKYYDIDFQFYTSIPDYNEIAVTLGNKTCTASVPHHINASFSNGNGLIQTGNAYHYFISCKDILVPNGMSDPVTLAIFFSTPTNYSGTTLLAVRYGISIVPSNKQFLSDNNGSDKLSSIDSHLSSIEDTAEDTNQTLKDTKDSINDDDTSEATDSAGDFFSGFTTNTHGLTGIITAPLTLIGNITSSTCSPLSVPLPFVSSNISLPCMSTIYSQYFGNFYTVYRVITFGIIAYWVCVRIFAMVKDFKNPEHDEIEVMDL